MKTLLLSATYVVGVGELFLAWYFWKTNSGSEIRKVMSLFALSLGTWVTTSALTSYRNLDIVVEVFTPIAFVFGMLIVFALLHISLIFPYPITRMDRIGKLFLYVPCLIFLVILTTTDTVVNGYVSTVNDPGRVTPGPLYILYNYIILFYYALSLVILFYRFNKSDGTHKRILKIFTYSILFGGLPAVLLDLVIPIFFPNVLPNILLANLATGVWLGVTSLVVFRKA